MNDIVQMTRLAEETLGGQRIIRHHCLVGNAAAEELEALGPVVLPIIRQTILQRVVPVSQEVADHHELMRRFPGLSSLWISYLSLARHDHLEDAVAFLRTLEGSTLAAAILEFQPVWRYSGSGELPPAVLTFLEEVASRPADSAAQVARDRLRHAWNRPFRRKKQ